MASETIPEKVILICDRCKEKAERYSGVFSYCGMHLSGESWGKGHDGSVGGLTVKYDFCQNCTTDFEKWVKNAE